MPSLPLYFWRCCRELLVLIGLPARRWAIGTNTLYDPLSDLCQCLLFYIFRRWKRRSVWLPSPDCVAEGTATQSREIFLISNWPAKRVLTGGGVGRKASYCHAWPYLMCRTFIYRIVHGGFYGLDRIWLSRRFFRKIVRTNQWYATFGNGHQWWIKQLKFEDGERELDTYMTYSCQGKVDGVLIWKSYSTALEVIQVMCLDV